MDAAESIRKLRAALASVIVGKEATIDTTLVAVLAGGHILLEDVPGVGKTTLAKALARVLDVRYARVQFTPDLLPSDILGTQILNPREGTFAFHKGPIFTNILLADEINRASPRTQSALLEAMNEGQVTVDGVTHTLPSPFIVIATQNPVDFSGTYPLPEAQLDRFLVRTGLGYPDSKAEMAMLYSHQHSSPLDALAPVLSGPALVELQAAVRNVKVSENVASYILRVVAQSRTQEGLDLGISPRGSLALFRASQAHALLNGRDYVSPNDVQALAQSVIGHRLRLGARGRHGGNTDVHIVRSILESVDIPT